jgi:RimJ/RimL family protein N-acetyltransferase
MKLKLRFLDPADASLILNWRNQPSVIRYTRTQFSVPEESHMDWFRHRLTVLQDEPFYIACLNGKPIGFVRFDLVEECVFLISILISHEFRGKGLGINLLRQGISKIKTLHPGYKLRAFVHVDNLASRKLFQSEGFDYIDSKELFMRFEKELN